MGTSGQGGLWLGTGDEMGKAHECWASCDGARGTRTPDLLGAIQALSQLSYSPAEAKCSEA